MKKIILDCFLFYNEKNLLYARIDYLKDFVDVFCIVESAYTFTGKKKSFNAKNIIISKYGQMFFQSRVVIFENQEYIDAINFKEIEQKYSNTMLLLELKSQSIILDKDKYVWLNDCYQRELIAKVSKLCVEKNALDPNDVIILVSDVDEIPSIEYLLSLGKTGDAVVFAEMQQFRYNISIVDSEKWIGTVKFGFNHFNSYSVNELRFATKRKSSRLKKYIVHENGGWHFTSFGSINEIKNKMNSWGHQELNTAINRYFLPFRLRYGLDIFGRDIAYMITKNNKLPIEITNNLQVSSEQVFFEPNSYHKLVHKIIRFLDRITYRLTR